MRITCPGCGQTIPWGFSAESSLLWCSSRCAQQHGAPDRILIQLRAIEAQAAAQVAPQR